MMWFSFTSAQFGIFLCFGTCIVTWHTYLAENLEEKTIWIVSLSQVQPQSFIEAANMAYNYYSHFTTTFTVATFHS